MDAYLTDATFWVGIGLLIFLAIAVFTGAPGMVARMLDERAAGIKAELEEARRLREEAQELLSQYQRRQREAQTEAQEIVAEAKAEAERLAHETRLQLEQLIARRTEQAESKIAQAEAQAAADVRAAATQAAVMAAETLIRDRMTPGQAEKIADTAIAELRGKLN